MPLLFSPRHSAAYFWPPSRDLVGIPLRKRLPLAKAEIFSRNRHYSFLSQVSQQSQMRTNLRVDLEGPFIQVLFSVLPQCSNIETLIREKLIAEIHLSFKFMLEISHDGLAFDDLINTFVASLKVQLVLQSLFDVIFESFIDEARSAQTTLSCESVNLQALKFSLLTVGHYFFFLEPYISGPPLNRIGYCINSSSTGIEQDEGVVILETLAAMAYCWLISYPDLVIVLRSGKDKCCCSFRLRHNE